MTSEQESEYDDRLRSAEYDRHPTPVQHHNYAFLPPTVDESRLQTSATFGPEDAGTTRPPADLVLLSGDWFLFYVDENTLIEKSNNSFKNLLPLPTRESSSMTLFLADLPSAELEIMLQAIYDVKTSIPPSAMEITTLTRAIDHLPTYGFQPLTCIMPGSQLYQYILSCATTHPLEMYALAAYHGIVSLAVTISSHTLVLDLSELEDDLCMRIGAVYLLRLFQLHLGRIEALKKLLSADLGLHNPNPECDFEGQKIFKGMWNLAIAEMFPNLKPNTTISSIRTTILSHTGDLKCRDCIKLRDTRMTRIITEWTMTPRNIAAV